MTRRTNFIGWPGRNIFSLSIDGVRKEKQTRRFPNVIRTLAVRAIIFFITTYAAYGGYRLRKQIRYVHAAREFIKNGTFERKPRAHALHTLQTVQCFFVLPNPSNNILISLNSTRVVKIDSCRPLSAAFVTVVRTLWVGARKTYILTFSGFTCFAYCDNMLRVYVWSIDLTRHGHNEYLVLCLSVMSA